MNKMRNNGVFNEGLFLMKMNDDDPCEANVIHVNRLSLLDVIASVSFLFIYLFIHSSSKESSLCIRVRILGHIATPSTQESPQNSP